jgi:hypothetical protein
MLILLKNSLGEKGRARLCVLVMQTYVTKVRGEVFAHFHAVAIEHQNSLRN